jgi:hypothetical protein
MLGIHGDIVQGHRLWRHLTETSQVGEGEGTAVELLERGGSEGKGGREGGRKEGGRGIHELRKGDEEYKRKQ